jgi:hypothetical protein
MPSMVDYLTDPKTMPDTLVRMLDGWRPDPETCREGLRRMIAKETEGLAALEERLRVEIEEPSRAGAIERAEMLRGPDGVLLARYVRMHDSMYNRAFKTLTQGEKEAAKEDASASAVDPFAEVEVLDLSVGRAGAPNEANQEGASGAVGTPSAGIKMARVDESGPGEGVTGPTNPLGGFETPPARGS